MVRLEEQQESVQRCLPLPRSRLPRDFFLLWQLALSPRDLHGFTENQAVVSHVAVAQSRVLRMQSG